MNTTVSKYKISLMGNTYTLISDEPEADILAATQLVENTMKTILAASPAIDMQKAHALAAIKLALSYVQLEQQATMSADQQAKLMDLFAHVEV